MSAQPRVVVIGAGPAGLTAAYQLVKAGAKPVVLEADDVVGGISRTVERDGWRFDIGGHRFFTKVPEVESLWHEILDDESFLQRPRMSRIFYRGKLFDYPLKAGNALKGLGVLEAVRCVASYVWARVRPPKDQSNFEGWTAARFGRRLYSIFFKTYTEKLWGVPATEIQSDWAAQRIKNLSLLTAVWRAIVPAKGKTDVTSLIDEFQYPKYGPGMMWERCRDLVLARGGEIRMRTSVVGVEHADGRAVAVVVEGPDGRRERIACDHVISSMPMGELLRAMAPAPAADVVRAATRLRHRDFLTVALVVPASAGFPDNWIYVHEPGVRLGRVQNFGSWSPFMVKDGYTCLGLEYFVNVGDDLWTMSDEGLIALGTAEIEMLGLVTPGAVSAGYVVRMPKAYPVYDEEYVRNVDVLRGWLAGNAPNVWPVGRNGMHRYNNQDHSMLTAMLAVENILTGAGHDLWSVNVEEEYHEEKKPAAPSAGTGRDAPVLPRRLILPEDDDDLDADEVALTGS
ncbi:MAG TPA: NAD(P)/FAD-dependent oxidoreductase [Mycobacteriales bacterium]|nr:NAD(P)/FAD-dependent oxidoreductase [Mycobacteriales bacterium]